jgi:anti-anti-sigma regulatory factor
VILDFEGVSYIDDKGMTMLEKFKDEKIIILNSSPFIKSLLNLNETSYVG